ncbi:hypothetical protein JNB88_17820 [Rhizobium cauense]|uniref:DUF6894 family protein n=1 Tax=Rhizobium cauense TaxID=1166683 RepID=UPI001C6E8EA3|nr:hypothetical protein [Rhizobium cauense]MBW9115501.1 hypothetical protein [Rhizobium cauense]
MRRFYFHLRTQEGLEEDLEGSELETPELAIEEAKQAAREMMAEKVAKGEVVDGTQFEIMDEEDVTIAVLPLKSVVRIE